MDINEEVAQEVARRMASPEMEAEIDNRVDDLIAAEAGKRLQIAEQESRERALLSATNRVTPLRQEIERLNGELAEFAGERKKLALKLVEADDSATNARLEEVDTEIRRRKSRVEILGDALAAAGEREVIETTAKQLDALRSLHQKARRAAISRAVTAYNIEGLLLQLSERLQEYADLSSDCNIAARSVTFACTPTDRVMDNMGLIAEHAGGNSGAAAAAFIALLHGAGVGRVGVQARQLYDSYGTIHGHTTFTRAVTSDAARLDLRLSELVERKERQYDELTASPQKKVA